MRRDGTVVVAARIEAPGTDSRTLWYAVPEREREHLPASDDPFLVGTIYLVMQHGLDVHLHGSVSPSLLRNLEEFQAAWADWKPELVAASISADHEEEAPVPEGRDDAVVAFSGGVDSCFTAFRHARRAGPRVPYRPTAGVMVHGFDIPLTERDAFASAAARAQSMLASLGLELIPMATNYRDLVTDWSHSFGPALASCLMLLSGRFKSGLIGQGLTYSEMCQLHEGSNPVTDPLLSSSGFQVVPDGTAFGRASKIFAMREWDEFLRLTRVCWQGPLKDQNCCTCEKCIRNILTFRALGLGLPPSFEHDVDDDQISRLVLGPGALPEIRYAGLSRLAAENGVTGRWTEILDRKLRRLKRIRSSRVAREISRVPYYLSRIRARLAGERE